MKEVKRPFIGSPIFANVVEDEDLIGFIHKVSRVYATGGSREFSSCSWHRVGYMVATLGEDGQVYVDGSWCIARDSYDQDRGIGLALKYINMQKNGHTPMIKQLVDAEERHPQSLTAQSVLRDVHQRVDNLYRVPDSGVLAECDLAGLGADVIRFWSVHRAWYRYEHPYA